MVKGDLMSRILLESDGICLMQVGGGVGRSGGVCRKSLQLSFAQQELVKAVRILAHQTFKFSSSYQVGWLVSWVLNGGWHDVLIYEL